MPGGFQDELLPDAETLMPRTGGGFQAEPADPLKQTIGRAMETSPDQAARVFKLQLKTGLPAPVIERNLDAVEREAAKQNFNAEQFRKTSPALAQWLQQNPDAAKLTHDDLPQLSTIEHTLRVGANLGRVVGASGIRANAVLWQGVRAAGDVVDPWLGTQLAAWGRVYGKQQTDWASRVRGDQAGAGWLERNVYGAVESVGLSFAAIAAGVATGNPETTLAIMGAMTGGEAYGQARDEGVSVPRALTFAVSQAAIEVATEKIPIGKLLESVKGKAGLIRTVAQTLLPEIGGEEVATFFQDMNEWAVLHPDKPVSWYLAERPGAFAETLVQTVVAVGAQAAAAHALERATGTPTPERILEDLHRAVEASATRERAPEALQDIIRAAAKDGLTHVYAPVDEFTEFYQAKGDDPAAVALRLTGNPDAYAQAIALKGDLEIPTENYLTQVERGSDEEKFFKQELRLDPNGKNARETREDLQAEAEQSAGEDGTQAVVDRVAAGLLATGRYSQLEAESQARLHGAVYSTLATQHGVSPMELYTRFSGPITAEGRVGDHADPTRAHAGAGRTPVADVQPSTAPASETSVQRRVRYAGQVEALVAHLTRDAQTVDPTVDEATIRQALDDKLAFYDEAQRAETESGRGQDLLRAIAERGGLWWEARTGAYRGEVSKLAFEGRDAERVTRQGTVKFARGRAKSWNGVAGVFNEEGQPPDQMVRSLMQDPQFQYLEDDLNRLLTAVEDAMRARPTVDHFPGSAELEAVGVKPGTAWWPDPHDVGDVDESAAADGEGDTSFEFQQDTKGAFNPITRAIRLLKTANRSTFLHESAHLFLEMKSQLALEDGATEQERADMATLLQWFGFDGDLAAWRALSDEQRREHHERFARAFEQYLGEGKAPVPELQPIFARFRRWLIGFYQTLTRIPGYGKLTADVRQVMDRLVATQEAIDAAEQDAGARSLFTDAQSAGVSDVEFNGYKTQLEAASAEAQDRLQARLMQDLRREQEQEYRAQREQVRAEMAADVEGQPVYRALAAMRGTLEGSPATPLSRDALVAQYGKDILRTLPHGVYSATSGLPADTIASLFGFADGEALLHAITTAPSADQMIESRADAAMEERFPSLLANPQELAAQAQQAVAGEQRDRVVRAELAMLNKLRKAAKPSVRAEQQQQRADQQAGAERLRTEMPDAVTLQRMAQEQVATMRLRDIRPDRLFATARRYARQAIEFAAKQKFDEAVEAKQMELLNLALYREATLAREAVDAAREQFDQMFHGGDAAIAKRRNMDYVHAARAVAALYFWPERRLGSAREALELIEKHDPETYEVLAEQVRAALSAGEDLGALTFEAFQGMREAVEGLWEQSIRQQQMLINGQLVGRHEVIAQLEARLDTLGSPVRQEPRSKGQTRLLGIRAALRRVESWCDYVDGGDPDGVFRRYIWTPISEATARYRVEKANYLRRYLDLVRSIEGTLVAGAIAAPELNHTFASRAELLHAFLHIGNESNYQKLLRGRQWGEFDEGGNLDDARWRAFQQRAFRDGLVTKADMDFVQSVWDLVGSVKAESQQAHREMYGTYFREITSWPIETPWGSYAGGYVPAVVDPLLSADAAVRNEKQALSEGGNAFMFPTTGRGFTKSRQEFYARPLALDLRLIPQHLDKVLRFIHLEPRVKDAGRLLWNFGFRARLDAYDPTAAGDMIVPWLQRAASQRIAKASAGRAGEAVDAFFRALRSRTGLNMMAGNVINTLQQFTGLSVSLTKVRRAYLRSALWDYVHDHRRTVDGVLEASTFMRTRMTAATIEIQRTIDDLLLNPTKYEQLRAFGDRHGYFMQAATQNVVDIITWTGAYNQAMTEHTTDPAVAVREADAAVRLTQGSFAPEDVARFEAQVPFIRLFSMFSGYFNMLANTNGSELAMVARDMGLRKGAGRALYIYAFGFMIPAVLSEVLTQAIGGWDDDDDDTHLDEFMALFFGSQARAVTAMLPGGSVANSVMNFFNDRPYDDRISASPAITMLESAARAPYSVYQAITEDGKTKRAVRDALSAIALLTGLPVGAIARPAGYLADVHDEKAQPENAAELARGLVTGRTPR